VFVDQLGITGVWDAGSGTLTLSGVASVANYQAALRTVQFVNASQNPTEDVRTIEFAVDDGTGTGSDSRGVDVAGVNDPPLVTAAGTVLLYTEDDGLVEIDSGLTVSDVDSATLVGVVVRISAGYAPGEDVLSFVNQLGITGVWDAGSGTLTLSGLASVADYETALRSVRFVNASQNPTEGLRTIEFTVDDGADITSASRGLYVAAVNDPPVIAGTAGDRVFIGEGAPLTIDGGLVISDADNQTLVGAVVRIVAGLDAVHDQLLFNAAFGIVGAWDPQTGELTLSGVATLAAYESVLRSVQYVNSDPQLQAGQRGIQFEVFDGEDSAVLTHAIAVLPAQDEPVVDPPDDQEDPDDGEEVPDDGEKGSEEPPEVESPPVSQPPISLPPDGPVDPGMPPAPSTDDDDPSGPSVLALPIGGVTGRFLFDARQLQIDSDDYPDAEPALALPSPAFAPALADGAAPPSDDSDGAYAPKATRDQAENPAEAEPSKIAPDARPPSVVFAAAAAGGISAALLVWGAAAYLLTRRGLAITDLSASADVEDLLRGRMGPPHRRRAA